MSKATSRHVAVLAVLAASSFLVTACGGGPAHNAVASLGYAKTTTTRSSAAAGSSSSASSGPTEAQLLKYAMCMRSRGEPNFPEPNAQGLIKFTPTGILDPSSPQFQKAQTDCEKANNGGFDVRMSR